MHRTTLRTLLPLLAFVWILAACNLNSVSSQPEMTETSQPETTDVPVTPTAAQEPERLLSICMGQEPSSLFLYADSSISARSIRQAIYDGPFDVLNYQLSPVILQQAPKLEDGTIRIEPVTVHPGNLIVDGIGKLVNLDEGVLFFPSGCAGQSCALTYTGQEPVQMDQVVVQFEMQPGVNWSDGTPLTANDSQYSFELAKALYPQARADVVSFTQTYTALNESTVEWRGVPGYQNAGVQSYFFTPLPRHAWGNLSPEDISVSELANLTPLGWGPYSIDEWVKGDHITLSRNPNYFRSGEGLPAFNKLVFRFVPNKEEALAALLAGECDYLDETNHLEDRKAQLIELQDSERASVAFASGTAWEHLDFGILPFDTSTRPLLFNKVETRQAVAMCLNRQAMVAELFAGQSEVPNSYIPSTHPLYNPDVTQYADDPQAGAALLETMGWLDGDGDPNTPRVSLGVEAVPDGTLFEFEFLTTNEPEKQNTAAWIQKSLAECGISVTIKTLPWEELFAAGPEGPVFGRNFSMTQFGWMAGLQPPCALYTSDEIPGPYPEYSKGWGGANAAGYSNPSYNQACNQALRSLPGSQDYQSAHFQAQKIFSDELPVIPLYQREKVIVARPDMCGIDLDAPTDSALWNIENFDYGDVCVNQ